MVDWQLSILDPERSCPEEQNGTVVSDESEWIQGYMDRHLIDSGDAELDKGERDEPNAVAGSNYITPTALLKEPFDEESFEALDDFDHIDDLPDADNRKVIRMLEPGDAIVAHARSANVASMRRSRV
ncbi:hypothetical protein LXG23DRAFT_55106 [Yarrowia lipolytica]|nr:hypothetical protein LXG23DRAFT_55106 [Yarrowia lipolytica]